MIHVTLSTDMKYTLKFGYALLQAEVTRTRVLRHKNIFSSKTRRDQSFRNIYARLCATKNSDSFFVLYRLLNIMGAKHNGKLLRRVVCTDRLRDVCIINYLTHTLGH